MKFRVFALLSCSLLLARCAPAPTPPPAAALPCNCSVNSIVFFDPGQSTLTPKTVIGLAQDAQLYARQPPGPVTVSGGADFEELNTDPGLSRQRAEAVAAQLASDGVPTAQIAIRDNRSDAPPDMASQLAIRLNKHYATISFAAPSLHAPPPPAPPATAGPYQLKSVVLYEMPKVLQARLGSDPSPFRAYLLRLNAALAPVFAAAPPEPGLDGAIVIGLKPGGDVRSWLVDNPGTLSPVLANTIQSTVQTVAPPPVQNGPIAFAIQFTAWGGGAPITTAANPVPYPAEWSPAPRDGINQMPDIVFDRIWP